MTFSAPSLILSSKCAGDFAQARLDLGRSEEIVLDPRNTELFFHVTGDVVHRAVAVQDVELGLRGGLELRDGAVAGPLRDHPQTHLFEQDARGPGVAADVVVADDRDVIGGRLELRELVAGLFEHPIPDRVVGDVVAERLRHAAEAFATHRNDRLAAEILRLRLRHRLDIVADQADRAFRLDADALAEREQNLDLVDELAELLVAAEHDVLLLEVGGELHRAEGVDTRGALVVVAARTPGILAAADRTMADMDHVLDRTPDHAL